ncbi:MAG: hypothetical protein ACP5VS_06580 [Desulfomonilaceae bacterium]
MSLKSLDIVIVLKLITLGDRLWSFRSLAKDLFLRPSVAHLGVVRALESRLIDPHTMKPRKRAVEEFLVHGVKYVFPAKHGGLVRGTPTSYAAPPLNSEIIQSTEHPPVWPYEHGKVRGYAFTPLHECVPRAAETDTKLYELLALLDAIRGGRTREASIAITKLQEKLGLVTAREIISTLKRVMEKK